MTTANAHARAREPQPSCGCSYYDAEYCKCGGREPLAPLADREMWTVATYLSMNPRARVVALAEYRANNSAESAQRVEAAVKRGGV